MKKPYYAIRVKGTSDLYLESLTISNMGMTFKRDLLEYALITPYEDYINKIQSLVGDEYEIIQVDKTKK